MERWLLFIDKIYSGVICRAFAVRKKVANIKENTRRDFTVRVNCVFFDACNFFSYHECSTYHVAIDVVNE
jgi:hypothetical protein